MKKGIYIILLLLTFSNCSKDDDPANSFKGRQEIEIILDDLPPIIYKGGDYYESLNEHNADFTKVDLKILDGSNNFSFTMKNTNMFNTFSFYVDNSFSFDLIGKDIKTVENPYFFSSALNYTDDYDQYRVDDDNIYAFGSSLGDGGVESSKLTITEFHSNGNEKVIDGERKAYPYEKIKGNLVFSYKNNSSNQLHNVKVNFNFEGDNIIKENDNIVTSPPSGGGSNEGNELLGKWYQTPQSCANSSGERNYLHFKSDGKLTVFQADCNSACSGGGVTTKMNYKISGNQIIHTPTSVSEYCGQQSNVPAPFTVTYTISSNGILTIDGNQQWKK